MSYLVLKWAKDMEKAILKEKKNECSINTGKAIQLVSSRKKQIKKLPLHINEKNYN